MKDAPIEPTRRSVQSSSAKRTASNPGLVAIPWGPDGHLDLLLPSGGLWERAWVDLAWPDLGGTLADYHTALEQALNSPLEMPKLEYQLTPGSKVAIIVDDPSRWTPVSDALPCVLQRLHRVGVRAETWSSALESAGTMLFSAEAMRRRLGDSIVAHYRCDSPPVDDLSAYISLGRTSQGGVPVHVYRPVAEADMRILIGSVLPHLQAGFGGGYKLIFPGTSHRSTLVALHRQGLEHGSDPAGLIGGDATSNPMRRTIHAAAELLGPCCSVSHLIGGPGQVFQVLAGHPIAVQDALAMEARQRFQASSAEPADLIVVGNYPWPGDPMQSFKVLLHHRAACQTRGVLVGLFWTDPAEVDRSFPIGLMLAIAKAGAWGSTAIKGLLPLTERLAAIAGVPATFMLRWARELVVDRSVLVYAPPLRDRFGPLLGPVQLFADQASLWDAAERALRRSSVAAPALTMRVFPYGGLTYVARRAERSVNVTRTSLRGTSAVGRG